jgi:hypothetical protein
MIITEKMFSKKCRSREGIERLLYVAWVTRLPDTDCGWSDGS